MAVAVTIVKVGVFGDLKYTVADLAWDSSYPTGGEALTPEQLGLSVVVGSFDVGSAAAAALKVDTRYDTTNEKIQAFGSAANAGIVEDAEISSTDDLSALTNRVLFLGY